MLGVVAEGIGAEEVVGEHSVEIAQVAPGDDYSFPDIGPAARVFVLPVGRVLQVLFAHGYSIAEGLAGDVVVGPAGVSEVFPADGGYLDDGRIRVVGADAGAGGRFGPVYRVQGFMLLVDDQQVDVRVGAVVSSGSGAEEDDGVRRYGRLGRLGGGQSGGAGFQCFRFHTGNFIQVVWVSQWRLP